MSRRVPASPAGYRGDDTASSLAPILTRTRLARRRRDRVHLPPGKQGKNTRNVEHFGDAAPAATPAPRIGALDHRGSQPAGKGRVPNGKNVSQSRRLAIETVIQL